jgi:intracellular multiplication protein IcmL
VIGDQLTLIKARKNFYRDYYRRACVMLLASLVLILILSLLVVYLFMQRPLPDFYATSMNGRLSHLTPLSSPNYSGKALIE